MLDIKFVRENPEKVKENIKKKFQDQKLELVDKVIKLDEEYRGVKVKADNLRKERNEISDNIGALMREGKKEEAKKQRNLWAMSPITRIVESRKKYKRNKDGKNKKLYED